MSHPPLEKRADDAAAWFVRELYECLNKGPEKRTREGWQEVIAWWLREASQKVPINIDRPSDQLSDLRFEVTRFYLKCLKHSRHTALDTLAFEHNLCYSLMLTMGWYRWDMGGKPSDVDLEHFTHYNLLGGIVRRMVNDGRNESGPTGFYPFSATAKLKNVGLCENELISVQLRRRLN